MLCATPFLPALLPTMNHSCSGGGIWQWLWSWRQVRPGGGDLHLCAGCSVEGAVLCHLFYLTCQYNTITASKMFTELNQRLQNS